MRNVSNGSSKYIIDSTGKGNYTGSVAVSGSSANYAVNQVFDLAGNLDEWTSEANDTDSRSTRGGYVAGGSYYPTSWRYNDGSFQYYGSYSARSSLYVKSAKTDSLTAISPFTLYGDPDDYEDGE